MNVKQLKDILSTLDNNLDVYVYVNDTPHTITMIDTSINDRIDINISDVEKEVCEECMSENTYHHCRVHNDVFGTHVDVVLCYKCYARLKRHTKVEKL